MSEDNALQLTTPVFTEVRVRQFYKTMDGQMEVMPTTSFFVKDNKNEVDVSALCDHIAKSINTQMPGKLRPLTAFEIKAYLIGEFTIATAAAASSKTSLVALEKPPQKEEKA